MAKFSKNQLDKRYFDGLSRFITFPSFDLDEMTEETTIFDILKSGPVDMGRIVEGSPGWAGDDVEVNKLKDTEGGSIRTRVTPGTLGYEMRLPHTEETAKRVGANERTVPENPADNDSGFIVSTTKKILGINPKELAGKHMPCGILNGERNEFCLFPRGVVSYNPTLDDDDLMEYGLNASADECITDNLDTMMFIPLAGDPFKAVVEVKG